jgi:hypothetical protein
MGLWASKQRNPIPFMENFTGLFYIHTGKIGKHNPK